MLRVFVVLPLLFIGLVTQAVAQGVCVPPTLKVASVSGKVIRTYSKGEESLHGTTITVRKGDRQAFIVAKVTTDADGRFTLQKMRSGKYLLVVEFPLHETFAFLVHVSKSFKSATRTVEMVIHLGLDPNDACRGGYAELRKRKP